MADGNDVRMSDGLINLVANLGTARDKAASSTYGMPCVNEVQLTNAYRGSWVAQKIVRLPALDAVRNWRSWNAEKNDVTRIEAEETRLGLQAKLFWCKVLARLYGGGAILIGDGSPDPSKPLDPAKMGKGGIKYLTVIPRRQLTAKEIVRDVSSEYFGKPGMYMATGPKIGEGGGYRQIDIHPSRLVVQYGRQLPDDDMMIGGYVDLGWSDSILTSTMQTCLDADATAANVTSLIYEAKVDCISIPNLSKIVNDPKELALLTKRFGVAATLKAINGTLLLDGGQGGTGGETWEQKQISVQGLPDVVLSAFQLVAGGSDIPLTRFIGQSPGGLSGKGESEERNYAQSIAGIQKLELNPGMTILNECIIRSALGSRPDGIWYTWSPISESTDAERADIAVKISTTIKNLSDSKTIPLDALTKSSVNLLVESGVMPGLDEAVEELPVDEQGSPGNAADDLAAAGLDPETGKPIPRTTPVADALPRTLYVRRDLVNVDEFHKWAVDQGFEDVVTDAHVAIAYSWQPVDWMKVGGGGSWTENDKGQIVVRPGGPRVVEPLGSAGAIVLLFNSSDLAYRHMMIREAGASWDYEEYQPHVTITYSKSPPDLTTVEPYRGKLVFGPEIFEEVSPRQP